MFGLDEAEVETLVRLAAATADESNSNADGGEYDRALASFGDAEEVHRLAASTWARIEREGAAVTGLAAMARPSEERLFLLAVDRARKEWGPGWEHLGSRLRRALVGEEVLAVAAGQDDAVSAEQGAPGRRVWASATDISRVVTLVTFSGRHKRKR